MIPLLLIFALHLLLCSAAEPPPAIHYTLQRRGGAFSPNWTADLEYLAQQVALAESRFNFTRREVKGNKIVRVPKALSEGGGAIERLLGLHGREGNWFSWLKLGKPKQLIELDIDMLTADFAVTTTSSGSGSRFDDFFSKTYAKSPLDVRPFPNCGFPSDETLLPTVNVSVGLSFAHCKPSKSSRETLQKSGAMYGLAPSDSLRQMENVPSLIQQLIDGKFIEHDVFSLTLINGEEGLLSLGGTVAQAVARVEERIEGFLGKPRGGRAAEEVKEDATPPGMAQNAGPGMASDQIAETHGFAPLAGNGLKKRDEMPPPEAEPKPEPNPVPKKVKREEPQIQKRQILADPQAIKAPTYEKQNLQRARARPDGHHIPTWRDEWKWSPVEGAAGWWQILMRGLWTNGVRVMKNQAAIIDINTPFILAPPLAAKAFYASISGAKRLPPPYTSFYAYPCNNPPQLHFEFGGWRFPVMRGTKSPLDQRGPNGKFSLGKVAEDTGYCVGAVVETRMGVGDVSPIKRQMTRQDLGGGFGSLESGMLAGNGLRDVWVLGEQMFRGLGVVFDRTTKEVGFRTY